MISPNCACASVIPASSVLLGPVNFPDKIMLGLFLLSFLVVSSTIARTPRLVDDYDYYSTYDESPAQTESGTNAADTSKIAEEAADYSNNEDYANDDYSHYDREPPAQKEVGADASEEEVTKKEEDNKKDDYANYEYWHDENTNVEDLPGIGDEKDAQAETQSSKEQESDDYDYNYDISQKEEDAAGLAAEPGKNSNEGEQSYEEDYEMPTVQDYNTNIEEESKTPIKEEANSKSTDYDNYADNYDYEDSAEMEGPTQKEKDENDMMTEQESDYDHKYEWHDSQNSKDYEEDYVQKRVARGIKRVPRRHRPHRRPHHRHHKQGKQPPSGDISPTPTTHSPHPNNPASSHSPATSSSPPTVPTPSANSIDTSPMEPSSREILLQHAINSYTVTTMHQLDASKILQLYKQGDAKTRKFAKTLFKTLVAMRLAHVNGYRGFDQPSEVVSILKKDHSTRHTDFFIVRFLYKYYKGFTGAIKYYLRVKVRSSSLDLQRHGENEVAHQNENNVHRHFHRGGHSKHEVNKRDQTVKGRHRAKDYFKRKLEAFRKKRALVAAEAAAAAAAQHDTDNTANQNRVIPDFNIKQLLPQKLFRRKRSQHRRPHRPQRPLLPTIYEAAQKQKAKGTCLLLLSLIFTIFYRCWWYLHDS